MKSDINAAALRMLRPGPSDLTCWLDVLTVDPGLGGTGVAFWPVLSRGGALDRPEFTRVIHERDKTKSWQERCDDIAAQVGKVDGTPKIAFIEIPRLWARDKTSRASASRGDLTKLSMLAGAIMRALYHDSWGLCKVLTAFPADWKGQLPKSAVLKRIEAALGRRYRDHEADAVGMGLAIQGIL